MNFSVTTLFIFVFSLSSKAFNPAIYQLNYFETQGNAISVRSLTRTQLPHIEIPAHLVQINAAHSRMKTDLLEQLFFEKEGVAYIRWIINPEDKKYYHQVVRYLKEQGYSADLHYHFEGFQSASRSYFAEVPKTPVRFSTKTSTDSTGGSWQDKRLSVAEANDARLFADYVHEQNQIQPFKNFSIQDEPLAFMIPSLNQGMIVRLFGGFEKNDNKKIYLPGFAALHESVGREIALRNGSSDPFEFWNEHYIQPVGRALGEMAGRLGTQYDSKHSQQFLIELDENYKPTGQIVLRDLSDFEIYRPIAEALIGKDHPLFTQLKQKNNISDNLVIGFAPLKGNIPPSWMKDSKTWEESFFSAARQAFASELGIPNSKFLEMKTETIVGGRLFEIQLKNLLAHKELDAYFARLKQMRFKKSNKCSVQFM